MDFSEAVSSLDRLAQFGWKLDLGRIRRLCEFAGHPERAFPAVLVGGTNGKGSTCACLGRALRAAGMRVGISPKPHLHTVRERVVVSGQRISEEQFAARMTEIQPWITQVEAEQGSPTVFEALTLLAFLHFARARVDHAVVEVGLGGRFDATNVIDARHCVITNISLDHTERLGDTVEAIAFEKAGILKPGNRLVTGASEPALGVILARASELGVPVWRLGEEIAVSDRDVRRDGATFTLATPAGRLDGLRLRLLGAHQVDNAALAAATLLWMRQDGIAIDEGAIRAGLAAATMPARLQVLRASPTVIADGAHNPAAARALALALRQLFLTSEATRLWLVLGGTEGHDTEAVIATLAPLAERVFATAAEFPRALDPQVVADFARAAGAQVETHPAVADAYAAALARATPDDVVCVTGSLFVAAEVVPPEQ